MKSGLKFLFVTNDSLAGDLAWVIRKEGHEVKYFISHKEYKDVHDGFVEKVDDWREHIDWADVIIFDDVGFGKDADMLRKKGKLVVGGSEYTDRLEDDRGFGQDEMKRHGLLTLKNWDFSDYDEALRFISENPKRYVYKPTSEDYQSIQKDLIFIGAEDSGNDLIEIIKSNKKYLSKKVKQFQLQEYVSGVEVGTSAFFNGKKFVSPVCVGFEHKRMFPNNIGPLTGEMGTMLYWDKLSNRIFKETTYKFESELARVGYVGFIDINCIVNKDGIFPLEFTCRFGYPFISIQMEGITSPWGEFFYGLAKGEDVKLNTKKEFQVGVVCCVPPFPFDDDKRTELYRDLSVIFRNGEKEPEGVHLGDVKIVDDVWRVAGDVGYVLIVTGSGKNVKIARKVAYARIKNIIIQNMYYRNDIGQNWRSDRVRLKNWGYIQ